MSISAFSGTSMKAFTFGSPNFIQSANRILEGQGYAVTNFCTEGQAPDLLDSFSNNHSYNGWQFCVCEFIPQTAEGHTALQVVREVRKSSLRTFIAIWSLVGAESAALRLACFELGANMVTQCEHSLREVAAQVFRHGMQNGNLECAACGMQRLTEDALWQHYPLFHVNQPNLGLQSCCICDKRVSNFAVHLRNEHGPPGRGEMEAENRKQIPLYSFALVVCQHPDGRFLLVQEFCNQGFWLPGGAVDPHESLSSAAIRETKEEAGVDIELTGILKIEHASREQYVRMRWIFAARPKDANQLPKSIPDYESVGASWVSLEEISQLRLRGTEPIQWCNYVASGGPVYPLSLLQDHGK
mmetsp:Transcript_19870/g.45303  ORF Transcript_19870/g.45303 Transcript_19870/m.45303 type:complete len:356 (-) Transcript_19870:302-1369(-)